MVDVDHDDRACARALLADRRLQLAVREVLDAQVDRQHEVAARARGPDAFDVLHDAAVAVLDDALRAVLAREPMIERELEPFLAGVVDVGEAEHVAGDFAGGVVAAVFAQQVHARNAERPDLLRLARLAVAREIEELAIEVAGDPPRELLAILS